MGRFCRTAVLVIAVVGLFPGWATSEESSTLQALERVRVGLAEGISYRELGGLLDDVRVEVSTLRKDNGNDCFRAAVNDSYYWYDVGRKTWGTMTKNTKQRDKYFRQAEYGEHRMRTVNMTMAENYDKPVKHTQDALPTKWEHGSAALERARRCLEQ
jgi:hypothetical protein